MVGVVSSSKEPVPPEAMVHLPEPTTGGTAFKVAEVVPSQKD